MRNMRPIELQSYLAHSAKTPSTLDIQLLDVREQWEYNKVHLPHSILIPIAQIPYHLEELKQQSEIVVICHHGIRSRSVCMYLEQNDFPNTINLNGGIDAWTKEVDPSLTVY